MCRTNQQVQTYLLHLVSLDQSVPHHRCLSLLEEYPENLDDASLTWKDPYAKYNKVENSVLLCMSDTR